MSQIKGTPPQRARTASGKAYWRSLDRLLDSPVVREQMSSEFPAGADRPPPGTDRRTMLKLMGASFALAGLASCRRPVEKIVPQVSAPENVIPGLPKFYASSMPVGSSSRGILVESHVGRPTKIEGNDLHPFAWGSADSWTQAAILGLYDPDRSTKVLHRPQGAPQGLESSWEAFIEAWKDLRMQADMQGGQGIAVLLPAYASPSISWLAAGLKRRFPQSSLTVYEPVGDENVFEGLAQATGQPCRPIHHFDKARTILSVDADFLLTEGESVACARDFASGRRAGHREGINRLYAIESTLSLTGCNADHRIVLPNRQIPSALAALALHLKQKGLPLQLPESPSAPQLPDDLQRRLRILAQDLAISYGEAVIVAGRAQPASVHALALALNQALGAMGETLSLYGLQDVGWGGPDGLCNLSQQMRQGAITTLFILGGNPVYTAPAELGFAEAFSKVPHTIHLSSHCDETSQLAEWQLPQSHFLESWGDVRLPDGKAGMVQPLISPLYDSRSELEVLGMVLQGRDEPSFSLVRGTWLESVLGGSDFEARWNRALHDGFLQEDPPQPLELPVQKGALARAFRESLSQPGDQEEGLEAVFQLSHAVHDGRWANNGWLQELPHPVSKICWDNPVLVSLQDAQRLELENGDLVRLRLNGQQAQGPIWIAPGQAPGTVTLTLGYGRSAAGRVGNGVGFDAYPLRRSQSPFRDSGLVLEKAGRRADLAQTQEHWSMEGRSLVREATWQEYLADPAFAQKSEAGKQAFPLFKAPDYSQGYQWGMAIDLTACTGCNACVTACQSENNVPIVGKEQVGRGREMHWLRIDRYFSGEPEDPQAAFQPVPCMHCEKAPCEQVCPVAATVHDQEGLNVMVYNRCIGTRYCSNNCPYKVRRFNFFNYTKDTPETVKMLMNPDVTVRSRGVMEKCTYCVQRIQEAKIKAKREGRPIEDGQLQTACQQTCPTQAIAFGNLNDPESRVSQLKAKLLNYTLLAELDNKPRTSYLARLRNPNPDWEGS